MSGPSAYDKATGALCPPAPTLSYEGFGRRFFEQYCNYCHTEALVGADRNGTPDHLNFDALDQIRGAAFAIDAQAGLGPLAQNRSMPPAGVLPSDEERRMLSEWLACGAPSDPTWTPGPVGAGGIGGVVGIAGVSGAAGGAGSTGGQPGMGGVGGGPVLCPAPFGDCDGNQLNGCEQVLTTLEHCGACATPCGLPGAMTSCETGACELRGCLASRADCDTDPSNGCEVPLDTSAQHCGRCQHDCLAAPNVAQAECVAGICTIALCAAGNGDCDGQNLNGCEQPLATLEHCGQCGRVCAPPHALGDCSLGVCAPVRCEQGFADCDLDPNNGCEVDVRASVADCGACGQRCEYPNAGAQCLQGGCGMGACHAGWSNCDADPGNGCETSGSCQPACPSGFMDCDLNPANGCETNILSSAKHCGGCGVACLLPNVQPRCDQGACQADPCIAGWSNCDGDPANGCETPGACPAPCPAGFGDCDADPRNGCETNLLQSTAHCGGCGRVCKLANAVPLCALGSCQIQSCELGWFDCDGIPDNGCEALLACKP